MELNNSYKLLSATQYVPARSLIEGDLKKYMTNPFEEFFPMPYDLKDGTVTPLLYYVADYCLKNNVISENIPAALIVILTLNSVRLGYPIAIILQADDPMIAEDLLTVCKEITPKRQFIEFHKLSSKELFQNQGDFKNKTIICLSPRGCKDATRDIQNLISTGSSCRQVLSKSNFGDEFKEVRIQGPNAFIGVENGDEKFDMNDPSILRITLSSNEGDKGAAILGYRNFQSDYGNRYPGKLWITRLLERLSHSAVDIPYGGQISSNFMDQKVQPILPKYKPIHNLISLLSITNNPPPFTKEEALGYIFNQNLDEIFPVVPSRPAITATKVEHFLMTLLLKDIIPLKNEYYTPVQITIFDAVNRINMGKLSGSIIDKRNDIQVLMTLHKSNNYWAKIGDIFERVNSNGAKVIPFQVIENELNKLAKLSIITKKRILQTSDFGYYINNTSIGKHITFLNASLINDPKFNMAPVQVVNPLTEKLETI